MKIIISPAKKMKQYKTSKNLSTPAFLNDAIYIGNFLKTLTKEEISKSFKIKGKLLDDTMNLINEFDVNKANSPALLTYDGIQYKYLDAKTLSDDELNYLNSKLSILSAIYGVLRPFDAITFYRLEMQAEFKNQEMPSMYSYWANKIHMYLYENNESILNLASLEYSKVLKTYLTKENILIDVYFYELENGKLVEKGVYAKMMRGLMVRYIAKNKIDSLEELKKFNELNYKYSKSESNETKLVFIKQKEI